MDRLLSSPRLRLTALALLLLAASLAVVMLGGPSRQAIASVVEESGVAGPIVYVVLYVVSTLLLFPGALVTAAGGLLFGAALGTLLAVISATIGATGAFLIGRRLVREQVEEIAGGRIGAIDRWIVTAR